MKSMTGWAIVSKGSGPRSLESALGVHGSADYDHLWGMHFISIFYKRALAKKAMAMNAERWPDMELVKVEVRDAERS